MCDLRSVQTFKWFTTPKQLRRLADRMENRIQKSLVGDTNLVSRYYGEGQTTCLEVRWDQGKEGE